jgi:sugar lactone lactonase YvrE|tara:strand:+ start:1865 stop:2056 length:192 start_codon:yes stop_codon:yes gene_type:complete
MHKIKTSQPEVLWNSKCILGEGVTWVKEHNSLYYVDIKKKRYSSLITKTKIKKFTRSKKKLDF